MSDEIDDDLLVQDNSIFLDVLNVNDDTCRSNSFLEDSFSSCIAGQVTSTPMKPSSSRQSNPKKDRLPCPKCTNTYANERTLAVHVKMHAMKGASSRIPRGEELNSVAPSLFACCVEEIVAEEKTSGVYLELLSFCDKVMDESSVHQRTVFIKFLVEKFVECCGSQNALMPSALRASLYVNSNRMLCSVSFRESCLKYLHDVMTADSSTINLFLGSLILKLFEKVLAYVLRKMRGGEENDNVFRRCSDRIDSPDFQQVVYHISGFIMHSFVKKGENLPSNNIWCVYVDVLKRKFLADSILGNVCSSQASGFTSKIDRGGLKHCSSEAFDFFLLLFDFLMNLENSEGSLPFSFVEEKVATNDAIIFWWDNLVGCDLTEEQSLDLLVNTVHSCARVVSKGIMKRRLNNELRKSYTSIPLRSRLGR